MFGDYLKSMKNSMANEDLVIYVKTQMETFFPAGEIQTSVLAPLVKTSLERVFACFMGVKWPGYEVDGAYRFNYRHSDQYASFLYFLANSAKEIDRDIAERAYLLNKALHGLEAYFEICLPDQFLFVHPVGTVLGRASYGTGFTVYQNCSVGSNLTGEYPVIGDNVAMFSGSRLIGQCVVGGNVMIAAGTTVLNSDVPANTIAAMIDGHLTYKTTRRDVKKYAFCGTEIALSS